MHLARTAFFCFKFQVSGALKGLNNLAQGLALCKWITPIPQRPFRVTSSVSPSNDYNRYDATMIDARHKEKMSDTQFPKDLERAYELSRQPDFLVVEIVDHDGMAIL